MGKLCSAIWGEEHLVTLYPSPCSGVHDSIHGACVRACVCVSVYGLLLKTDSQTSKFTNHPQEKA